MSEIVKPEEMSAPELITYAGGKIINSINASGSIAERRQQTIKAVRFLNDMWQLTGGERRIAAYDARFRGRLPFDDRMAIATGSIEGTAVKFEPWIYNDVKSGVMARYLIMLTISDASGRLTIGDKDYQFNDGNLVYHVDLAHSAGPFEEVA